MNSLTRYLYRRRRQRSRGGVVERVCAVTTDGSAPAPAPAPPKLNSPDSRPPGRKEASCVLTAVTLLPVTSGIDLGPDTVSSVLYHVNNLGRAVMSDWDNGK